MDLRVNVKSLQSPTDVEKLVSAISEIADELDVLYTETAPNGAISARTGRIALYNNGGTYETWQNIDGGTTWQRTNVVIDTDAALTANSDSKVASQKAIKSYVDGKLPIRRILIWFKPGDVTTGTNISARIDLPYAGTIKKTRAYAKTAPTGADLIFDINKNGTSIWNSTQSNRVKIAASSNTGSQTSFDTTSISVDDYFTIDIDQIGSTVAGSDITVELEIDITV